MAVSTQKSRKHIFKNSVARKRHDLVDGLQTFGIGLVSSKNLYLVVTEGSELPISCQLLAPLMPTFIHQFCSLIYASPIIIFHYSQLLTQAHITLISPCSIFMTFFDDVIFYFLDPYPPVLFIPFYYYFFIFLFLL